MDQWAFDTRPSSYSYLYKKLETEAETKTKLVTELLREKTAAVPLEKLASIYGEVKTIYFFLKSSGSSEITATNILIDGGASRPY